MPATASSALRAEVRAVLRGAPPFVPQPDAWLMGHAPLLTSALGEAGLIGVTWPEAYGGRAASARDRMIVTEELLRVGAPVAAHWVADRQIGPAVLRYGSDQLRKALLPGIAAGDITFCLGMSEPDSGSDLAAVRTRAIPVDGGFEVTGRKIWTSNAHRSTHAYVLARLPGVEAKHEGLTELVLDLGSPGIEVSPILDLSGEHHFNEMVLEKVFVPADNVIGTPGDGWRQVTEQLAHERGGVERVFSSYPVLDALLTGNAVPARLCEALGAAAARLHALRGMADAVACAADEGGASVRQAAMLKLLGTEHEAAVTDLGRRVLAGAPVAGRSILDTLVAKGIARAPGATLRGGTTEVLLGILARDANAPALADPLARLVQEACAGLATVQETSFAELWDLAVELEWNGVGVAEEHGGSGGTLHDLSTIARALARSGLSGAAMEGAVASAALQDAERLYALALQAEDLTVVGEAGGLTVTGRLPLVPWAPVARSVVIRAGATTPHEVTTSGLLVVDLNEPGVRVESFRDLAGDPVADVVLDGVPARAAPDGADPDRLLAEQRVVRAAALVGAMEYATQLAVEHCRVRTQFGRPLAAFQAVAHQLARLEAETTLAGVAVDLAVDELERGGPGHRATAAHVLTAEAAGTVAKTAHQVLGAIGVTHEHPLHRATLRLWAWRDVPNTGADSAEELGAAAAAAGADRFWDWLTHESDALVDEVDTELPS